MKSLHSKWECCQFCRKKVKKNLKKRDNCTNGLSCSKCEEKINGQPLLIHLIEKHFDLEINHSLYSEIVRFIRGDEYHYDESDLKRIGVKEVLVYPKPSNSKERRFYCPLTQLQMRLCPLPNLYSIRRISSQNAYIKSMGGLIEKNPQTESERFARTYFFLCKKQNQVKKKLTKIELKKHQFHQENLQLLKEFGKEDGIKKIGAIRRLRNKKNREEQKKLLERMLKKQLEREGKKQIDSFSHFLLKRKCEKETKKQQSKKRKKK